MKTAKKSFLLLSVVFCFVFAAFMTANAQGYAPAVFKTTEFEAMPDNTVQTTLYLDENSGVIDFEFQLNYDSELVTLVSADVAETLVGDVEITPLESAVHVSYTRTSENLTKKTEFVTFTFHVNGNDGPGSYDFLWLDEKIQKEAHTAIDGDLYALPIETEFSQLKIYNFGDTNLSGNVSIADVTYLRQYLAEIRTFSAYQLALSDAYYDKEVTLKDAVRIQQYLANKSLLLGNRVNIRFIDKDGDLRWVKSVVYGENLVAIPALPEYTGYYGGVWSLKADEAEGADFQNLTDNLTVYAVYKKDASAAVTFYKERLSSVYYSETALTGNLNLVNRLTYQDGFKADIYWSSSNSSILNATTGIFNKPQYDTTVTLTATIISYCDGLIEAQDYIVFDYTVEGEFLCPTKTEIEEYLKNLIGSNVDYNMTLPSKVTDENISSASKFEVRLEWYQQNADGTRERVVQLSRANDLQKVSLIAVTTFNGTPLEGNGEIHLDDISLSPITAQEIRNYIITQIAANTNNTVTDNYSLWDDDNKYNTVISWESGNKSVAEINSNIIQIKDVVDGTPLPITVEVRYTIDGKSSSFKIPYTVSVSTSNSTLFPGQNIDPELYDAIKSQLGINGNLTTETLKDIKFVYLDLSKYPDIKDLSALTYCSNLRVLNISGLKVSEESLNQIASLTKLEALIANHCGIESMTVGGEPVLDKMINLKMLDLSYNNLTSLDSVLSKNNRYGQMQELYLNDNQLTDISALCEVTDEVTKIYDSEGKVSEEITTKVIKNRAPMLRFLILDNNHLNNDDFAAFSNFMALKYLSLGNNDITSVSCFKDIRTLLELHLHGNNIEDIRDLRYLTNLQSLYLSHNNLRNIYSGAKEVNISYLKYLTNLEILYLNDNRIEDLSALDALNKLTVLNVNNNNLQTLSFLADKGETLVELYAENNEIESFSFIRELTGLKRLLLSGNSGVYESSLCKYLSGLTQMQSLTLSGKDLRTLAFLDFMPNLVRLDIANCNVPSYYPESFTLTDGVLTVESYTDNIEKLLALKSNLQYLDISNSGFGYGNEGMEVFFSRCGQNVAIDEVSFAGGTPADFNALYEMTNLKVLYADNLLEKVDANSLFTLMTGLCYLSMENCGIDDASWLYKFRGLIYVDLADNEFSDFDFRNHLSPRSRGTLTYLYLDTDTECEFADAYDSFDDNSLKELSLGGVNVGAMDKLPDMASLEYLDLSNSSITNLVGENSDFDGWFNLSRYKSLKNLNLSGVQADIDEVSKLPELETFYAVGTVNDAIFQKRNLLELYSLYNKGVTCYLYNSDSKFVPRSSTEGSLILGTLDEYGCDLIVAADHKISKNNPELPESVNGFDILWEISNQDNYAVEDGRIIVTDYTDIDDETLTLTATIEVYPNQEAVSREYTVNTHILRAKLNENIQVDTTNAEDYLVRESEFTYNVECVAAENENFDEPVMPVFDAINYSYSTALKDGTPGILDNVLTEGENHTYVIKSDATLGATVTLHVEIGHNIGGKFVPDTKIEKQIRVSERTFTVTYVPDGGTVIRNVDGMSITSAKYEEDSTLFNDITIQRPGYKFDGWYTDSSYTNVFWNGVDAKPIMPSEDLTLYAKWAPYSYVVYFNANGGTVSSNSKAVLNGDVYGDLPTPSRTGYTFNGWYTEVSGGARISASDTVNIGSDITVYAYWTPNNYTVTFDACGGWTPTSSKTVTYEEYYGDLPTPSRTGFTFNGWYNATGSQIGNGSVVYTASNHTLYARWLTNAYTVSWSVPTAVSITVRRTSSPYVGAYTGVLGNGETVYYGDTLSVSYVANTGYSLSGKGAESITVTGNINSGSIYASAYANNYTYNVVYVSSNGTNLGGTTVTYAYDTINTVYPAAIAGYITPSAQSVAWDATWAKTITFYYTPATVASSQTLRAGTHWTADNGVVYLTYSEQVEYRNRTASTIEMRVAYTLNKKKNYFDGFPHSIQVTIGGVADSAVTVLKSEEWGKGTSYNYKDCSKTVYSNWVTVPVSATATSVNVTLNSHGTYLEKTFSDTATIPTY